MANYSRSPRSETITQNLRPSRTPLFLISCYLLNSFITLLIRVEGVTIFSILDNILEKKYTVPCTVVYLYIWFK
jgi:hypothetical protein